MRTTPKKASAIAALTLAAVTSLGLGLAPQASARGRIPRILDHNGNPLGGGGTLCQFPPC